ncbi:MAG: alpha/beta hydrolase family protein [Acidobacteriaceae bacterium]
MTSILFRSSPFRVFPIAGVGIALFAFSFHRSLMAQAGPKDVDTAQSTAITNLLQELGRTRSPRQAAISPDGRIVAWVAPVANAGNRVSLRLLHGADAGTVVISVPASDPRVERTCSESDVAWSPDSKRVAFVSDCATPGQQQVFLSNVNVNAPEDSRQATPQRLTSAKGYIHDVTWSPDGKRIGFLFVENATRPPGALAAMKPAIGVISAKTMAEIQRVAVVDVSATDQGMPQVTQATPSSLHIYDYDWSPNSKDLAYIAAAPPGEDNWWVAQLYVQSIANDAPQSILKPKMQIAAPRWSPDGHNIAFIGGLMSDYGETGGDIYMVSSSGGEARDLTPGRKSSPAWPHWIDNRHLGFTEVVDGESRFSVIDPATGSEDKSARVTFPATIGAGVGHLSVSFSKGKRAEPVAALIQSSFNGPPEVWAGPLNKLSQITHLNDSLQRDWGRTESLTWNNEGFRVQGWLIYPKDYDPQKKYPLILWVHGGPANQMLPHWPIASYNPPIAFSALDYFMLLPNPRGSYGEGEAFTAANRKDFGYGDLRDLLAGVDVVTRKLPIDPDRIGITGWSYGGFMTMFAVTQTHRFRAAVAGAGISDWKSYYGENSIDQWMVPFFGASVYDDPAVYAKSSAINFIKNAKTPMLIVVGDRDGECPAPQSFEMWHALNTMHVPVKLVVYPNEGHGFSNPTDERDVLERSAQWFDRYMPAKQPADSTAIQQ